jgi:hypothetical protein
VRTPVLVVYPDEAMRSVKLRGAEESCRLSLVACMLYSNEIHPTENEISSIETEIPPTEMKYLRLTTKSVSF